MDGGPKNRDELEEMCALRARGPRPPLLDAWIRGRYAAQVGFRVDNPYRNNPQMAAAWLKGWESADRDRSTA